MRKEEELAAAGDEAQVARLQYDSSVLTYQQIILAQDRLLSDYKLQVELLQ